MTEKACWARVRNMNLDFYRNYIAIVEAGTLSAAARNLHVAQSALSTQVKQFEESYQAQLFVRNARQMEPTDAGRILYERAKSIVTLIDESHKEVDACVEGAQGTVRIGMTQAYPDTDMTRLLLRFQQENPGLRYEIFECSSEEIAELLRSGVIEIGVIRISGLLPPYLEERRSLRQRLCIYCRNSNPWITSKEKEVSLRTLDGVPLAVTRGFEPLLRDLFQRENIRPIIKSVSTSRSNAVMWANAGVMAAIVCNEETASFSDPEVFCRPLTSDDPVIDVQLRATRFFVVVKGRVLSPAAQRFLDNMK